MQLQDIIDYCEGSLSPEKFYDILIGPDAKKLFEDSPPSPPYAKSRGMVYYYLIEQNYKDIGNLLNVQSCLVQFLRQKGVSVNPSRGFDTLHDVTLKAQPAWLRVPTEYMGLLLDGIEGTDAEKPGRLKKALLEKFQYMKKPPRWVQDAVWPIVEGEPLFFIGQMDISPLSHDTAQLFIFYDKRNKQFHTIVQSG